MLKEDVILKKKRTSVRDMQKCVPR